MKRHELEHLIRAAGAITGADEIVVIGSQAILAVRPDAPAPLLRSMEADMFTFRNPGDADLIDGSIGEGSPFHETFGYYAQGVAIDTAVLPEGWKSRLVTIRNANTRDVTGLCLEPHDLAVSKLAAGREKDREFVTDMCRNQMLDDGVLVSRISLLPISAEDREQILARWNRVRTAV